MIQKITALAFVLGLCLGTFGEPRAQPRSADGDWMLDITALTLAPDGTWGAATDAYVNRAIGGAVARCKATTGGRPGCGAYLSTIRAGWGLGIRCGDHIIVVAERLLADAERRARRRENDLRTHYAPDMPSCVRVVTVDPAGRIIVPKIDDVTGRLSTR